MLTVCGHRILVTHGHKYPIYNGTQTLKYRGQEEQASLVLYGHTHVALSEYFCNILILNPGSCASPRAGQRPCFALIDLKQGTSMHQVQFMELTQQASKPYIPKVTPFWF